MIHETIRAELTSRKLSTRKLCLAIKIDANNTGRYLKTGRGLSVRKVELILRYLDLILVKNY